MRWTRAAWLAAAALAVAPVASRAQEQSERASTVKEGKDPGHSGKEAIRGESAGQTGDTGPAGPGIERGTADGMAGGRTDRGPKGEVGIADDHTTVKESRARANAANRKANARKKAPQRADVEGGGEGNHDLSYAKPLPSEGKKIPGAARRRLEGDERTEQPGGAAEKGSAGHTGDTGPR